MKLKQFQSIIEVSEQVRLRKISPVELVKDCLERIKLLNPKLNAFITILESEALQEAKIAEAEISSRNYRGPLHGIPVAVKDFYDTAGIRTTAAFVHFKDRIPTKDASVVNKLKEAGAVLIGKTNMHELGMGTTSTISHFGEVHNPWNLEYIAGGSSGGSAAAVAAGLCYATVDTDAVGSCRLPAACCGVVGFKGTYGLIDLTGILEGEKADEVILKLAHAGIMTRCVEDTFIMLKALMDSDKNLIKLNSDFTSNLNDQKKYTIGIVNNFNGSKAAHNIILSAVKLLEAEGHTCIKRDVPFQAASFNISLIDQYRKSIGKELFNDIDILLLPTTTDQTPTIKEALEKGPQALAADNTFFCNYFSLPAISVPAGFDQNGLPMGIQFVGPPLGESIVLDMANAYQLISGQRDMHPKLSSIF